MSLFDRIAQSLDKMLSSPSSVSPEDEAGHLALLEQSSGRIRETIDAIKRGNLIAASSTTEDFRCTQEMRYQDMVGGPRLKTASFAENFAPSLSVSQVDRVNASLRSSEVSR